MGAGLSEKISASPKSVNQRLSLHYMMKYATTCDDGTSTFQADTILTPEALPEGVVTGLLSLRLWVRCFIQK